jgi:hypothetical protein
MKPGTHNLGGNRAETLFAKALSNGGLQLILTGPAARTEINLSAEQAQLLQEVIA